MTNEEWIECHDQEDFEQAIWAKANKDPDWYSRILSGDPAESLGRFVAWLNEEHDEEHEEEHEMTNDGMLMMAKRLAATAITDFTNGEINIKPEDMYVVWFCKTLQNWKALVSTDALDGKKDVIGNYIEVTHNGDRRETYCDLYKKQHNVCFKDMPEEE